MKIALAQFSLVRITAARYSVRRALHHRETLECPARPRHEATESSADLADDADSDRRELHDWRFTDRAHRGIARALAHDSAHRRDRADDRGAAQPRDVRTGRFAAERRTASRYSSACIREIRGQKTKRDDGAAGAEARVTVLGHAEACALHPVCKEVPQSAGLSEDSAYRATSPFLSSCSKCSGS